MQLNDFIEKFSALFDDTDPATITAETQFRELDEWSSMTALSLIALADEEYNVKLTGDDIRSSSSVNELFEKISSKN